MIEIIYKEEQKKAEGNEEFFEVPKNIRQIGEIKGHQKIYIEDYAYTFLKTFSEIRKRVGKRRYFLENITGWKDVPTCLSEALWKYRIRRCLRSILYFRIKYGDRFMRTAENTFLSRKLWDGL